MDYRRASLTKRYRVEFRQNFRNFSLRCQNLLQKGELRALGRNKIKGKESLANGFCPRIKFFFVKNPRQPTESGLK